MISELLKKVLCINDNEITLWIQKQILIKSGVSEEIITLSNGMDGINYCRSLIRGNQNVSGNFPGLILLDLHMPIMDGWEFLDQFSTEVHPHFKETKIIITSYSINELDSERSMKYPFVIDFLTSTLSIEYLENLPRSFQSRQLV